MKCHNDFCIYNRNYRCLLKNVELDITDRCESCVYPNIPPQTLEYEKEKLRNKFEYIDSYSGV